MDTVRLVFEAAWKVLWVGLLLGAGLPALFALGVKLTSRSEVIGEDGVVAARADSPVLKAVGWLCFAIVLYAVVVGIMIIVAGGMGEIVAFNGPFPHFAPKPH